MGDLPSDQMREILDHIYRGEKIQAVKLYREFRECSLLEAKEFVERLESELREQSPQEFKPSSTGCASVVAIAALLLGVSFAVILISLANHGMH